MYNVKDVFVIYTLTVLQQRYYMNTEKDTPNSTQESQERFVRENDICVVLKDQPKFTGQENKIFFFRKAR